MRGLGDRAAPLAQVLLRELAAQLIEHPAEALALLGQTPLQRARAHAEPARHLAHVALARVEQRRERAARVRHRAAARELREQPRRERVAACASVGFACADGRSSVPLANTISEAGASNFTGQRSARA